MQVYCLKCKEKKEIPDNKLTESVNKLGRRQATGVCPDCGTKVFTYLKNKK